MACEERFEQIYTTHDWYDGPRLGVADFEGRPHVYQAIDYTGREDTYLLKPVPGALMPLVLEDWGIWLRWDAARRAGRTTPETHPALPEDCARHSELQPTILELLSVDPATAIRARATFQGSVSGEGLGVRWERLPPQGAQPEAGCSPSQ